MADMKKAALTILFLLSLISSAFAAFDSFDDLVAAEEKKGAGVPAQASDNAYEAAKKEIEAVKKHLRFRIDKIENIVWVSTKLKYTTQCFDIYCGEQGGEIWLRLKIKPGPYTQPMVMERVTINVDGVAQSFMVPPSSSNITSELHSTYGIGDIKARRWYEEKVDMAVNQEIEKLLRRVADGKETLIRLSGRNYKVDMKLLKDSYPAFDAMLRYYRARQIILAHEQGK